MMDWIAEWVRIRSDARKIKAWRDQRMGDEFWARSNLNHCYRYSPVWHRIKAARKRLAA